MGVIIFGLSGPVLDAILNQAFPMEQDMKEITYEQMEFDFPDEERTDFL